MSGGVTLSVLLGTIVFVYFGTLISDIANAAAGDADGGDPAVKWSVYGVGIAATVAAIVAITVYARRELKKHIGGADSSSSSGGGGAAAADGAAPGAGPEETSMPLLQSQ